MLERDASFFPLKEIVVTNPVSTRKAALGMVDGASSLPRGTSHVIRQKATQAQSKMPQLYQLATHREKSRDRAEEIEPAGVTSNRGARDVVALRSSASKISSRLAPNEYSLREVVVDIDARDAKISGTSTSKIIKKANTTSNLSASVPDRGDASNDVHLPPAYAVARLKTAEVFEVQQRAKKSAEPAAKGPSSLKAAGAAAVTRAEVIPHGKSSSATVKDLGSPPPLDKEDQKMVEALEAQQRAKIVVSQAVQRADVRRISSSGSAVSSNSVFSPGDDLRPSPIATSQRFASVSKLLPNREQTLQQPASFGISSADSATAIQENPKRSAREKSRGHDYAQA